MSGIIYRLFLFVLIFSPLAFGTVEQWSLAVMETVVLATLVLFFIRKRRNRTEKFSELPGFLPLLLFAAWILFQLIPFPSGLIKIFSPGTYAFYQDTVWQGSQGGWGTISINRKATIAEFLRIMSYIGFYALTVQLLTNRERLQKTVNYIIVFGSALAFLAILQGILMSGKILFIRELPAGGIPFGPFVNRNHYAGFMGMLFPVVLAMFLFSRPDVSYGSLRDRISEAFSRKRTHLHILLGFSSLLMATSIFLSLSRGGIMSLSISMLLFGGMILKRRGQKRSGLLIIFIVILVLYSVGWFGWTPVFKRFAGIRDVKGDITELRLDIWKDSLDIIKQFPLTGAGFGSFVDIYPRFKTIITDRIVDHAHNDYIELATDGGIVAVSLFFWFLAAVLFRSYRVFARRREPYSVYLFIGSVTGIFSILIHGITDFNLHIGANGLYFFFLAGLLVSAANTRLKERAGETFLRRVPFRFMNLAGAGVFMLLVLGLLFHAGVLAGRSHFSQVHDMDLNAGLSSEELRHVRSSTYRASVFDPFESRYHYVMGNSAWLLSDKTGALAYYERAVRLSPANGEYLQALGLVLSSLKDHAAGEKLLRAGISADIRNPERYRKYSSWLLGEGRKEDGLSMVKTAISLEPGNTRRYITLLVLNGMSDEDIHSSLPGIAGPHMLFADYLHKTGRDDLAGDEYLHALDFAKNDKETNPSYFIQASQYFIKREDYDNALKVLNQAVEVLPENVGIRIALAQAYEKAAVVYRAVEEYRHVLLLDPGNKTARQRLAALK